MHLRFTCGWYVATSRSSRGTKKKTPSKKKKRTTLEPRRKLGRERQQKKPVQFPPSQTKNEFSFRSLRHQGMMAFRTGRTSQKKHQVRPFKIHMRVASLSLSLLFPSSPIFFLVLCSATTFQGPPLPYELFQPMPKPDERKNKQTWPATEKSNQTNGSQREKKGPVKKKLDKARKNGTRKRKAGVNKLFGDRVAAFMFTGCVFRAQRSKLDGERGEGTKKTDRQLIKLFAQVPATSFDGRPPIARPVPSAAKKKEKSFQRKASKLKKPSARVASTNQRKQKTTRFKVN